MEIYVIIGVKIAWVFYFRIIRIISVDSNILIQEIESQ